MQAERFGADSAGTEHLLLALLKDPDNAAVRLLNTLGISVQKVYVDTLVVMGADPAIYKEDLRNKKNNNRKQPSTLEQYSRDLTALAAQGKLDPVIGRDMEIQRVIEILSRRTKNNPVSHWRAGGRKNSRGRRIGQPYCGRQCSVYDSE